MARGINVTDRKGKSQEMIQRKIRLTEEENIKLNYLVDVKGKSLRDTLVELIDKEFNRIK